jgi:hypothetical protein
VPGRQFDTMAMVPVVVIGGRGKARASAIIFHQPW